MVGHSYKKSDVVMLLKDLSGSMTALPAAEREKAIQQGVHYSEMLPEEKEPSAEYAALYEKALKEKSYEIACEVAEVSTLAAKRHNGKNGNVPVLLSLARAGIPVGILMKRYLKRLGINAPHFAISIIRDKGIDKNAMNYVYDYCVENSINVGSNIIFVDGWTGKGAIKKQLREAVADLKKDGKWAGLSDELYALADPANLTENCGTHEDYMLPCACLNSTCAGLISRTILNSQIGPDDFHGTVIFDKFKDIDKSREFVDTITEEFYWVDKKYHVSGRGIPISGVSGMETVVDICHDYNVKDYKKVKPGIGETTRVLLRRVPDVVLVNKKTSMDDPDIAHILVLCREKGIPVERYDLGNYKVCGIIKELADA